MSNLNDIACAQTPEGLCASTESQVACWDPPPDVRYLMRTRDDLPQPSCITGLYGAACGYFCERTNGHVACATTPMGACATRFNALRCWDPALETRWEMEARNEIISATCERNLERVACGYDCQSSFKNVKCAQTPWGQCARSFDTITCWDPQLLAQPPMSSSSALLR